MVAFGVELPGAKRRLIPAVVVAALASAALAAATPAPAATPKQPPGVDKLWSEYPLTETTRTGPPPASTATVTPSPDERPTRTTRAAQPADDGGSSFAMPILLFLAAAAVLALAAAGRNALTTEGGFTMPELFRSRGRRTEDGAEHRPAAGVALAAAQTTQHETADAPAVETPPQVEDGPTRAPATDDFGRVGEHVAGIVAAAESAATTIRADAERDAELVRAEAQQTLEEARTAAETIKAEADSYAETRQREADAAAARVVDEAEHRALRIAGEAVQRDRVLLANIEASEQRLRDLARSLRTVASSLDDVVGNSEDSEGDTHPLTRADTDAGAQSRKSPVELSTRRSGRS